LQFFGSLEDRRGRLLGGGDDIVELGRGGVELIGRLDGGDLGPRAFASLISKRSAKTCSDCRRCDRSTASSSLTIASSRAEVSPARLRRACSARNQRPRADAFSTRAIPS
jgi:hypothetical protein